MFDSAHSFQYNVKELYILAVQANLPAKQAEELCRNALKWNSINSLLAACQNAFEGWKQTVEVCLFSCFDPQVRSLPRGCPLGAALTRIDVLRSTIRTATRSCSLICSRACCRSSAHRYALPVGPRGLHARD